MALSKILPASQEQYVGARNMVTNGAMTVNQRGDVTGKTATTYGGPDRWELGISGIGTYSISQSSTAPDGFSNSYKVNCTTADASPASGDFLVVTQKIEAQNLQHLQYGSSSAQELTLSFYVRSNKTGTYICELLQPDASDRHINKTYTISSANTWEYKTITFAGDPSGGINNDNGIGVFVNWWLGSGSDYSSGTLQTSWGALDQTARAVGNVNLADSTSNDWYITGVQLEIGEATPFEHEDYGTTLSKCQRYLYRTDGGGGTNAPNHLVGGQAYNATSIGQCSAHFPATMRAKPTFSTSGLYAWNNVTYAITSIIANNSSIHVGTVNLGVASGLTTNRGYAILTASNGAGYVEFDAEL